MHCRTLFGQCPDGTARGTRQADQVNDACQDVARQSHPAGRAYRTALTWLFTLFNSARVAAYLPTIWAIHTSGDSRQHSLLTWLVWAGANVTMAAWLFEENGRRMTRAIAVNLGNALMCVATLSLIATYRP